jgi:hypothetical protein
VFQKADAICLRIENRNRTIQESFSLTVKIAKWELRKNRKIAK